MNHSLRDLHASGYDVCLITGTNCLRPHEWVVFPIFHVKDNVLIQLDKVVGLFVRKDDVTEAAQLWPKALVGCPDNSQLVREGTA